MVFGGAYWRMLEGVWGLRGFVGLGMGWDDTPALFFILNYDETYSKSSNYI
jgi:hypothetical protein